MIDWNLISHFSANEFSENPDEFADPNLIHRLDSIRTKLNNSIYPSPIEGALARFSGSVTSQHYAIGRLSTAVDVFCEGVPIETLSVLYGCGLFTAVGIYLNTIGPDGLPWIMFHIDIRKKESGLPLLWITTKEKGTSKYYYPQLNTEDWSLLRDEKLYTGRQYKL